MEKIELDKRHYELMELTRLKYMYIGILATLTTTEGEWPKAYRERLDEINQRIEELNET